MASSFVTDADRAREIDRIHTLAVGTVLGACCQLFAAVARELNAECRKHCGVSRVSITRDQEAEAAGLIESMKVAIAEDLPIDPCNAVETHDDFDVLTDSELLDVSEKVRQTVSELLGVFND